MPPKALNGDTPAPPLPVQIRPHGYTADIARQWKVITCSQAIFIRRIIQCASRLQGRDHGRRDARVELCVLEIRVIEVNPKLEVVRQLGEGFKLRTPQSRATGILG